MSADSIKKVPGPWSCKAQVYNIPFIVSSTQVKEASDLLFSPLEAKSFFASAEAGLPTGGSCSIMIVRYSETPVGPYDEILILPGQYTYPTVGDYWNIPKHLARFDWKDLSGGAVQLKVFPSDTEQRQDEPFFQMTFKTVPFVPAFPASTVLYKLIGIQPTLVQPPVPRGAGAGNDELVGTDHWSKTDLYQYSPRSHVGWFDLSQKNEQGVVVTGHENFWPGGGRWRIGVRMDTISFDISAGEHWKALDIPTIVSEE
ncbi:hypothetical protein CMQ_6503 [Grosmannia clavigera kw1407]|uniref:Acetoacetate decarboxylase n=1 Tax=Grosmannia clavigera (strain kw1407 / UAMH 11150) TaxID=655863 RepID=F0X749_GROCL|nr:uncharacterized protein CMQ_6503 [Grosmannia clavigera kw1407]EFX06182.1 hypothetical protein CMQ_6503 [Grosmannia clavigera kw1407]